MTIRPFITLVVVMTLLRNYSVAAAGACIFNERECTCELKNPGGLCLRYKSGNPGSELCTSYQCGHGHGCNCTLSYFYISSPTKPMFFEFQKALICMCTCHVNRCRGSNVWYRRLHGNNTHKLSINSGAHFRCWSNDALWTDFSKVLRRTKGTTANWWLLPFQLWKLWAGFGVLREHREHSYGFTYQLINFGNKPKVLRTRAIRWTGSSDSLRTKMWPSAGHSGCYRQRLARLPYRSS